jgi:hypothetical protein
MNFSSDSGAISKESAMLVIKDIITSDRDLVANCRCLCRFRKNCHVRDPVIWNPIVGFESETDDYPLGSLRDKYSRPELERLDSEVGNYAIESWPIIAQSCKKLLAALSGDSDET